MALLDRLRPQPAWKHSDPSVRASAAESLPETEHAVLLTLAREDDSPRVRRAAVARLADVDALAGLASRDADTQVRADAGARLLALACAAEDASLAGRAAAALSDERLLAQVARTAPIAEVALATLDRVREPRGLATTARHAGHADVRLRALERLQDAADLVAVAINTEHKDVGLAAVERLTDKAVLNDIAERAKNKIVGKRARAIVRDIEARDAEARAAVEARARRQATLLQAVAALERVRETPRGRAELDRLAADWTQAEPANPEASAQFAAAVGRVREQFDRLDSEASAVAAEHAARESARKGRSDLIEAAQRTEGPDTAARLDELRAQWAAQPALAEPDQSALARAFEAAVARALERVEARARADAMRGEVEALIVEAAAVADEGELDANRPRFHDVQRRWRAATAHLALDRAQYDAFHAAEQRWRAREDAARAAVARTADENRARLTELADRAAALAQRSDVSIKELDHLVRDVRTAIDQAPPLPGEVRETLPLRLKTLLGVLVPRLREQRETDDWRRWANAGIQEELVKRVEALRSAGDLTEAARQLRDLRRQWKAVSAGPRDEGDVLWHRFKTAADEIQAKCDEHYARTAAEHATNLAARQAVCEQAEGLAQSTDWITTAETLKRLQGEWAKIGSVPREQAGELARRFRVACDTFFTRRKTDLSERKHVWADNAQKKDALCARAEAIAQSSDWAAAFAEIKQLQADWKAVGPVRKNRSEALWKRFRAACDQFFERYGRRHETAHQQRLSDREGLCQSLEALLAGPVSGPDAVSEAGMESPADPVSEAGHVPEATAVSEPGHVPEAVAVPEAGPASEAGPVSEAGPLSEAGAASVAGPQSGGPPEAPEGLLATVDGIWQRWHEAPGLPPEVFTPLRARFDEALGRVLARFPAAFKGSRFDLEAAAARRDALCQEVERIEHETAPSVTGGSSAATIAALLKESLAANTIGGRVSDESRLRVAADRVRRAQGAWRELGPMPGEAGRAFEARFQRACRRFFDAHPEQRHVSMPAHGPRRDHRPPRPHQRGSGPRPGGGPPADRR
jgi:hypothetical protein